MSAEATLLLQFGRDKSLHRRHPWIFSGAVDQCLGKPKLGETVVVKASNGRVLGRAAWSPHSQIQGRMWTFDPDEMVDAHFFRRRIQDAIRMRRENVMQPDVNAYRLIASESDGLPGCIVDQYGDFLVVQWLTAGAEYWRETLVEILREEIPCKGIYERSDVDVRQKEGLRMRKGLVWGAMPTNPVWIQEGLYTLAVDVFAGHKTGFYLDQRENRWALGAFSNGKTVLNAFSYTGGFSLAALQNGATHVLNLDASAQVLAMSERNHEQNGFSTDRYAHQEADVFKALRSFADEGRKFDLIVLDPPKFMERKSAQEKAARGYKDINRLAFMCLNEGGVLFTFSCSGLLEADLFQKIVADAALDAHRDARIIRRLSQAGDHPTALAFPEGAYLKGLICTVR